MLVLREVQSEQDEEQAWQLIREYDEISAPNCRGDVFRGMPANLQNRRDFSPKTARNDRFN